MPVRKVTPSRALLILCSGAFVVMFQGLISSARQPGYTVPVEIMDCDKHELKHILRGPMSQEDPRLIEWVSNHLVPPSYEPYNLDYYMSGLDAEIGSPNGYSPSQDFILDAALDVFLNNVGKQFFFVEAGAYDGEFLSNTLLFELQQHWTGLLVEPNKRIFDRLQTKHRKAWSLNSCLSTHPYPSQELFDDMESTHNVTYLANGYQNDTQQKVEEKRYAVKAAQASARLHSYYNASDPGLQKTAQNRVQCVPLFSILRALNIHHVHLFTLDVEGAQMGILNTIPWNSVSFTMIVIEHDAPKEELINFMKERGYGLYKSKEADYVFINEKFIKLHSINPNRKNKRKRYLKKTTAN